MARSAARLKVAHLVALTGTREFGGPSTVAIDLCAALARRGHDVTLASGTPGGRHGESVDGVDTLAFPVWRLPTKGFTGVASPKLFAWAARTLRRFDVVHVHAGRDLFTLGAMAAAASAGTTVVTQTHGMIQPRSSALVRAADTIAFRPLIRRAAAHLALNAGEAADLVALGFPPGHVHEVPNGVPLDALPERRSPSEATVVFCSRLHPRKRVLDFLEAAAIVLSRGVTAKFVFAGPDEGDLGMARRRMAAADLRGSVVYAGTLGRGAALELMAAATVFVLPAVDEPFGLALVEAMAIGVPVVCTTGSALGPMLAERGAAEVVQPSVPALAAAIAGLLSDPVRARELADRGRRTARELFAIDAVAERVEGLYHEARTRVRAERGVRAS